MTSFRARLSAAALALRWHAGTGTLVAVTAALTVVGAVPALSLIAGASDTPVLSLDLGSTGSLRTDWGASAVAWPQLQQLALLQLFSLVRGGAVLTLLIGAATLLALHLARTAARSSEVIVSRAIGASRNDMLSATLLEASALAVVALAIGSIVGLIATTALRAAWPGAVGTANLATGAAVALGVASLVMAGPLLLVRAFTTRRLVDDDRRPLTLIIPAMQLGAAMVVGAGGLTLRDATATQLRTPSNSRTAALTLQSLHAIDSDRLARAKRFAAFLELQQAGPNARASLASFGAHRGFGASAAVTTDCGDCRLNGIPVTSRTETAVHFAVSGDTFALRGDRMIAGRTLNNSDKWDTPLVAVISARMARELFQPGTAVGSRVLLSVLDNRWFQIVGVVDDVIADGLGAVLLPPYAVYVSVLQQPVAEIEVAYGNAASPPDALSHTVATLGTRVGIPMTVAERVLIERRVLTWFTSVLLGIGAIAVCIAIGGLLTMLRLWLDSQLLELGVRRAVGARRRDIHRLVLGRASLVALSGSLIGAWLGLIAWDVLPRVIPGASTWNASIVVATSLALSVLTLLCAWIIAVQFTRAPVGAMLVDGAG
jgi:putative ABC transport system permease protein